MRVCACTAVDPNKNAIPTAAPGNRFIAASSYVDGRKANAGFTTAVPSRKTQLLLRKSRRHKTDRPRCVSRNFAADELSLSRRADAAREYGMHLTEWSLCRRIHMDLSGGCGPGAPGRRVMVH